MPKKCPNYPKTMNIKNSAGFQRLSDSISIEPHNLYFTIEDHENENWPESIDINDKETARLLAHALLQWADS
jgi:hypothetical protein